MVPGRACNVLSLEYRFVSVFFSGRPVCGTLQQKGAFHELV
jgi:hypothetical protein